MQKRQILINAIFSVGQILWQVVILFFLYRFILDEIGVEQLGIWSVVLASTSVAGIAQFGLSGSVVKFVAKYRAQDKKEIISEILQTAAISAGLLIGIFLVAVYPLAVWFLQYIIPADGRDAAIAILPFSLLSLWLSTIAGIYQSGLDGYQRIDLRNMILMGVALLHFLICLLLVPMYGLLGLAYAQVCQSLVVLILFLAVLKTQIRMLPISPRVWRYDLFKEMIGYGVNFQVMTIATMLFAPATKALLAKFGGLTATGYYEMASRMILQVRALIVNANQVLVPAIAELQETNARKIKTLYIDNFRLLLFLALPIFAAIVALIPVISVVWIGHYESTFVLFSILLSIGWFLNVLNVPAYFANLGTGELKWNVWAHILSGVINLVLGLCLGMVYQGFGVVVGTVIALISGSIIILYPYHSHNKVTSKQLVPNPKQFILHITLCLGLVGFSFYLYFFFELLNKKMTSGLIVLFVLVMLAILLWGHPMRSRVIGWANSYLFSKKE